MPVFYTPDNPVIGVDGEDIYQGAISYWDNEVESLGADPDALNEFTDSSLVASLMRLEMRVSQSMLTSQKSTSRLTTMTH